MINDDDDDVVVVVQKNRHSLLDKQSMYSPHLTDVTDTSVQGMGYVFTIRATGAIAITIVVVSSTVVVDRLTSNQAIW